MPAWGRTFYLLKFDRTRNGATDGFQLAFSTGVKRPGCKADRLSSSCAEIRNEWIYTYIPPFFHNMHKNNCDFFFNWKILNNSNFCELNRIPSLTYSVRFTLIIFHLRLGFASGLFSFWLPDYHRVACFILIERATFPTHSTILECTAVLLSSKQ